MEFVEYFKRVYDLGEFLKVLKGYIIVFSVMIVVDLLDLPSIIIIKYGIIPFIVVLVDVCVFLLINIFQSHILKSFKTKNVNEIDSIVLFTFIFTMFYFIVIFVTQQYKLYKGVILVVVIIVSLLSFFYRLCLNKTRNISEDKNANVYDLRDFIESNEVIKINDYPILFAEKDIDYDLFNRDVIINKLYASIQACKGTDFSFVIGLEGPWGSGKTTIVNNVIQKITKNHHNDFIVINDFEPWKYNSQKALLISLFDKVLKSTGVKYSSFSLNSIVNTLFESIKSSNPIVSFIISVFSQNDSDDAIDKMKKRVCDYLEQNNKTIVIFIDNLDRTSASNIIFLFKIINTIFDLKRVVYVLSYDKERINELLNKNLNINEKYIEKIIQQEISITKLNRKKIHTVVSDCVRKLFEIYGIKKEKYNDFSYIIDWLSSELSDVREFKRILNSVVPSLSVENELYKPDLFALEIIRFINSEFYEEIYKNAQYYISIDFEVNIDLYKKYAGRKKEFNKEGKEYFEKVEEKYGIKLLTFASNIFPNVKKYLKKVDLRPEYETSDQYKDISLYCRVASAKYFDLYFNYNENEYVIVSKIYNSFIELISNQYDEGCNDDILETFNVLFSEIPKYYHVEIINKLWLARNDFGNILNYYILIGLINNSNKISRESGFLTLSPYQRACAIMATLFSLLNEEEKLKVISYLKKDIKLLSLCNQIMYWLNSSSLYYENKESDVAMFETLINDMYNLIITTPIDIYCDENYVIHNSWTLIQIKRKMLGLADDEDVDIIDYISAIMKPEYIYKVLIDIIGTSQGTKGYGYYINEKSIKCFFSNEGIVLNYLSKYPPISDVEKFVDQIFQMYKHGEADELGERVVYTNNYIDLY